MYMSMKRDDLIFMDCYEAAFAFANGLCEEKDKSQCVAVGRWAKRNI